jgi:glycosyltransferase involved in cell wall biosynthesis
MPRRTPASTLAIVLPVLDERALVADQVRDLLAIDGVDEVIVVDGGSRDGTAEVVTRVAAARAPDSVPALRLVHAPRGRGPQMAAGAAATGADVVIFVHCDVRLPHDAAAVARAVLAGPCVVAGAFRTRTHTSAAHPHARRLRWLLRLADLRSRYTRLPYGDQALFVWRAELERAGGVPPLPLFEDLALSRCLRARGRIATARAWVEVSGRRFQTAPLRYTALVNVLPFLYRAGVPPSVLQRLYENVR